MTCVSSSSGLRPRGLWAIRGPRQVVRKKAGNFSRVIRGSVSGRKAWMACGPPLGHAGDTPVLVPQRMSLFPRRWRLWSDLLYSVFSWGLCGVWWLECFVNYEVCAFLLLTFWEARGSRMPVPLRLMKVWRAWSSEKAWMSILNMHGFAALRQEPCRKQVTSWSHGRSLGWEPVILGCVVMEPWANLCWFLDLSLLICKVRQEMERPQA